MWTDGFGQCGDRTLVNGSCAEEGLNFHYAAGGFVSEVRYFDMASGTFVALTTTTDVVDDSCGGVGHFPRRIRCEDARITEVLCGADRNPGDSISLP